MDSLKNLKISLPDKDRVVALLPLVLIGVLLVGYLVFTVVSYLPQTRTLKEKSAKLERVKKQLIAAEAARRDTSATLKEQAAAAEASVFEEAAGFMSPSEAAEALGNIYEYAGESGVRIVSLQAQADKGDEKNLAYETQTFQVQAEGTVPSLLSFVRRIEEVVTFKTYIIRDVRIAEAGGPYAILGMNIVLYTSPYASAELGQTPAQAAPTQETSPGTPLPSVTAPAPTPTSAS